MLLYNSIDRYINNNVLIVDRIIIVIIIVWVCIYMNEEILKKFKDWLLNTVKLSIGTTTMYIKQVEHTNDFVLEDKYETIYPILQKRINTKISQASHLSLLKYMKYSNTISVLNKEVNTLIMDLKEMNIKQIKNNDNNKIITYNEIKKLYIYSLYEKNKTKTEQLHNHLLFRILYESAGRPEEVRQYNWNMIDYNNKIINVPKTITKRNKNRIVYLSNETCVILKQFYNIYPINLKNKKNNRIFFKLKNYSSLLNLVHRISKHSLNKKITPMYLRNSYITHIANEGIENNECMAEIREKLRIFLTHTSTETTKNYIKIKTIDKKIRLIDKYNIVK